MVQRTSTADFRFWMSILVVGVLVAVCDFVVVPVFRNQSIMPFYSNTSMTTIVIYDFGIVVIAGFLGLLCISRLDLPLWWRPGKDSDSREKTASVLILGFVLAVFNPLMFELLPDQALRDAPWLAVLTPRVAFALSSRAALNEEVVMRLFLFPAVTWSCMHLLSRRTSLLIGGLVTSSVFGLIHPNFFLPFFYGLGLTYIYYHRGLLPAMIVHFLSDVIPLVIWSVSI